MQEQAPAAATIRSSSGAASRHPPSGYRGLSPGFFEKLWRSYQLACHSLNCCSVFFRFWDHHLSSRMRILSASSGLVGRVSATSLGSLDSAGVFARVRLVTVSKAAPASASLDMKFISLKAASLFFAPLGTTKLSPARTAFSG